MRRTIPLAALLLLSACAGAQLEKQKKDNDALREKAGALLVQVKEKSDEADAARAAKAAVEAKLAETEGRLADAESRLGIANARIASLEKSNKDLSAASGASRDELGGKLNAAIAEKDALAKQLADAQKEKVALERAKNVFRAARDKNAAEAARLTAERDELAARLKAADDASRVEREKSAASAAKLHDEMGSVADVLLKEMQAGAASASQSAGSFTVALSADMLFADGGAKITDAGAAVLERVGGALKGLGPRAIAVQAHADNAPVKKGLLGGYDDAWALTAARAAAVGRWLHEHAGLDPAFLSAQGYGEFRPLKPNDSDENRAANRRIALVVAAAATP
jgi:chemotaxis protein MotB